MPKINDRQQFLDKVQALYGSIKTINRSQVTAVSGALGVRRPSWLVNDPARRVSRGVYDLTGPGSDTGTAPVRVTKKSQSFASNPGPLMPSVVPVVASETALAMAPTSVESKFTLVPSKAHGYVPFGNYQDLMMIIKSGKFYPAYVTGLSGNGKTMMIEQICANEKREMVRVNITRETDEDDLIGGFRLVDGATVWQNGPVIVAMERGAILLLDEVDLGDAKLMCLQPVLEGKSIFLKKINKVVSPAPGFTIVATANTKGKGSDDGRFVGTNVMNEAFLERFAVTFDQEYPSDKVEKKILVNVLKESNIWADDFAETLVQWAAVTRKTFAEGGVSEIISTRRLVQIVNAYTIFNQNRKKAVELCLNRFDVDTKKAFLDAYEMLAEEENPQVVSGTVGPSDPLDDLNAF